MSPRTIADTRVEILKTQMVTAPWMLTHARLSNNEQAKV